MEMQNLSYTKTEDLKTKKGSLEIDLSPFLGSWINTKPDSGQIIKVVMATSSEGLVMHAFGADKEGLINWGKANCLVFSDNVDSITANAFQAKFTFEDIDVDISSNVKHNVLVIQTYTSFKDGSNRVNYYNREFYGPEEF